MSPLKRRRPGSRATTAVARYARKGSARSPRTAREDPAASRSLSPGGHDAATVAYFGLTPAESVYGTSRVVILPVPFGGTVTYGGGTEKGPEAIRVASQQVELFDEETRREPYRVGIHTASLVVIRGKDPEPMVEEVERRVSRYLRDGKFVVTLGGEHSISPGAVKAYAAAYPGLTVVHFDAHSDLRESYHGTRHNHACAGARMREHARLIQIGIRSQSPEERDLIDRGDVETLFAYQMAEGDWIGPVLAKIPERTPVYVTMDLDYFDPSITLSLSPSTYSFTDINYVDGPAWPIVLPDVRWIYITTPIRGDLPSVPTRRSSDLNVPSSSVKSTVIV